MTISFKNMTKIVNLIFEHFPFDCFSDGEMVDISKGSYASCRGLIKRAVAKGEIISVRRGLYCLEKKFRRRPLNLFELAQKIYGPSAVSLESALSFHGWIPEAVHTIASVTSKRTKIFETPVGNFDYQHVIASPFLAGVELKRGDEGTFLMAKPLKALADYVFVNKKDWKGVHPLIYSLRIEEEFLRKLTKEDFKEIENVYSSRRVLKFLKNLKKELSL